MLRVEEFYIDVETSGTLPREKPWVRALFMNRANIGCRLTRHIWGVETPLTTGRPKIRGSPPSIYRPGSSLFLINAYRPNAKVGDDVDVERVFRLFIGRLTGKHTEIET